MREARPDINQIYGGVRASAYERPLRRLPGFKRIEMAAGASAKVEIPISLQPLTIRDGANWVLESGAYEIDVGHCAGDSHDRTLDLEARAAKPSFGGLILQQQVAMPTVRRHARATQRAAAGRSPFR